jgi:hypothetical protein
MTDEAKNRIDALQQAAEYRRRAASYTTLAKDAGDTTQARRYTMSAARELAEARRIEEAVSTARQQQ